MVKNIEEKKLIRIYEQIFCAAITFISGSLFKKKEKSKETLKNTEQRKQTDDGKMQYFIIFYLWKIKIREKKLSNPFFSLMVAIKEIEAAMEWLRYNAYSIQRIEALKSNVYE